VANLDQKLSVSAGSCSQISISGRVHKVDLNIQGVADDKEEDPGGMVGVNDDDDNQNKKKDFKEGNAVVTSEDDLVPINLTAQGVLPDDSVVLMVNRTKHSAGHIKIWKSAQRGPDAPLIDTTISPSLNFSTAWKPSQMPAALYVEGIRQSSSLGDIVLKLYSSGCSDTVKFTVPKVEMAVDANRDGQIGFNNNSDDTTSKKPFVFWVNDDQDVQTTNWKWSDPDPETIPVKKPDYSDDHIQSPRDLEDFARIWMQVSPAIDWTKTTTTIELSWRNVTGSPAVNIYKAFEADGGDRYLKRTDYARIQSSEEPYRTALATLESNSIQELDSSIFADGQPRYFLFEGAGKGKGELVLQIKQGDQVIAESSVYFDLKDIKRMYQRMHTQPLPANFSYPSQQPEIPSYPYALGPNGGVIVPPTNIGFGFGNGEEDPLALRFDKPPDEEKKCIVFVHGIDLTVPEYENYAESFFKRLWWEGYKGRLVAFRWGTPLDTEEGPDIFNDGEFRAWSYGPSLIGAVGTIRGQIGQDATISVAGHSLGNAVVGSALQQGLVVDNYVLLEAAVSMSCFHAPPADPLNDPLQPFFLESLVNKDAEKPTPNYYTELGYRGFLRDIRSGVRDNLKSYHNLDDFWLATGETSTGLNVDWVTSQSDWKPAGLILNDIVKYQYAYSPNRTDPSRIRVQTIYGAIRPVEDTHESMAYVARSRTRAIGAEHPSTDPEPGNPAPPNGTSLDLKTVYEFGRPRYDHSGQFQRNIQQMYSGSNGTPFGTPFYKQLMLDLRVAP